MMLRLHEAIVILIGVVAFGLLKYGDSKEKKTYRRVELLESFELIPEIKAPKTYLRLPYYTTQLVLGLLAMIFGVWAILIICREVFPLIGW